MRKIISLLLCAALLLCVSACKDIEETTPVTTAAPSPSTAESTFTDETMPHVELPVIPLASLTLTPTQEAEVLPDGTVLFEYNYPTISLTLPDGDMAETVMLDFLNRIDATRADAQQIKEAAGEHYTGKAGWTTYFYNLTYSPMRIDTGVLSLYGMESSYSGGMHPNHNGCAVNYDLTTGKVLKLRHILNENVSADSLIKLICDALQQQAENLFSDYALCVEDRFAGDFGADDQWYLSDAGLCFFFSPYEIAPYTSGTIIAEIPYDQLMGLMQDAFFPSEITETNGMIQVHSFEDLSNLTSYSTFSEITLDADGEAFVITTSSLVYHVKIEMGDWNSDSSSFTPRNTVFASNVLNASDAIILKADMSDESINFRISFTSAAGKQGYFLVYRNGNPSLAAILD